ncbi:MULTISPECIES: hypothetical protein [Planktothrix]|uniref:hypothetical protein n=1 Tax=Planktothrix TaxID=54304 RepID=UPI0020B279DB|nr:MULTISPECIES: hypothetical protein [Planktothrix]
MMFCLPHSNQVGYNSKPLKDDFFRGIAGQKPGFLSYLSVREQKSRQKPGFLSSGGQKPGFSINLSVEKQKLWQKPGFSTLLLGVKNPVS